MGFGVLILTFSKKWLAVDEGSLGAEATDMLGRPLALTWRADGLRLTYDVPRNIYVQCLPYLRSSSHPIFEGLNTRDTVIVLKNGAISRR